MQKSIDSMLFVIHYVKKYKLNTYLKEYFKFVFRGDCFA